MPLDPMKPATDLDATQEELTPREKQNRDGRRYNMIPDVGNCGFWSVLATTTPVRFTPTQWFEIKAYIEANYGVTGMQALFEIDIPAPEDGAQNNLHMSAHLRQDDKPSRPDISEPESTPA